MTTMRGSLPGSATNPSPLIECYPAAKPLPSRPGLIIFPGGGYVGLADYEGAGYAWYLAGHGIACFVVSYRVAPHRHPSMLEDALAAIAAVRAAAPRLGVAPDRIGVMGSSAGGHLAAHALVACGRYRSPVPLRPDFGVLCYPVLSMVEDFAHTGSRDNLLGPAPSRALMEETSPERHVTASTPPCFIWHTRDDEVVSFRNSTVFADRLHQNGVPFELHVFDSGPHGMGMDLSHPWAALCARWIASR